MDIQGDIEFPNIQNADLENTEPENVKEQRYKRYHKSELKSSKLNVSLREPRYRLHKDVVLPKESALQIEEALVKIRYHKKIYEEWGFGSVDPSGCGVILNFYGKPGTGKTLTAEALAGTLNMPFLSVGIAELESKFMGETAKNIQAIFSVAKENNALLFFDEADTLLGKRLSTVTQGVDNEVNASRSTLLIELERFDGVLIFASNFVENYDKAFESRISHHIHFQLPDLEGRKAIWKKHLVPLIPLAEEREIIIEKAAGASEGLAGRDVRTCMRLALPKPLLEAESSNSAPLLCWNHIEEAINQVRKAHKDVGQEVNPMSQIERSAVRNVLGLNEQSNIN